MRHCVAVMVAVCCASPMFAASDADTVLQARAILVNKCQKCHEGWKDKIANVADYRDIKSKNHLRDQIIELVEDGSMPPKGDPLSADELQILKKWQEVEKTKARPFPLEFNDAYILSEIAKHAKANKFPADVRYITLNVPEDAADKDFSLQPQRDGILQAIDRLLPAKAPASALAPLDPLETVFVLKLADIGWDQKVLSKAMVNANNEEVVQKQGIFNPYDLLLLEYPIGFVDPNQPNYRELRPYFENANLVRPFAYVSGDWLNLVSRSPELREEFARLRKQPSPKLEPANFAPMVKGDQPMKPGRIMPIDGLLLPNMNMPDNPAFELDFVLLNPRTKKPDDKFTPGKDAITIKIGSKNNQNFRAELIWIDSDQQIDFVGLPGGGDVKGEPLLLPVDLGTKLGRERMILFAVKSDGQANAMLYGNQNGYRRFIHSFSVQNLFEKQGQFPPLFDRNFVVKKTIEFEIVGD